MKLTKVLTAKFNKDQKPTKRYMVWAAFMIEGEAHQYAEALKVKHPNWVVRVRYPQ